mgnify:CR=1 FL=1
MWHEGSQTPGLGRTVGTRTAHIGGPFALIDQNGRARGSADFRGRFMLVYFGYTYCPDVCPTTLGVIADALDKMGPDSRRVVPIFITVDPARDTPKVLGAYLAAFGPEFVGLTGSQQALDKVESEYNVYARKHPLPGGGYGMDHSSVIYLMGPSGKLVTYYDDVISPAALAADLEKRF